MANVTNITGPDGQGHYKAFLDDGNTMTFGRTDPSNTRWHDPNDKDRYWYVSIDTGRDHTTFIFIVETRGGGLLETGGMWCVRQVKAKGSDKDYWKLYAVAVLNS